MPVLVVNMQEGWIPSVGCTYTKHRTPKLVLLLIQTSQNYRLPKIKVEPSIKLYCRMSNIDEDEILELEFRTMKRSDFLLELHHPAKGEGSQKRRFRRLFTRPKEP
jgi:hypothetical protein